MYFCRKQALSRERCFKIRTYSASVEQEEKPVELTPEQRAEKAAQLQAKIAEKKRLNEEKEKQDAIMREKIRFVTIKPIISRTDLSLHNLTSGILTILLLKWNSYHDICNVVLCKYFVRRKEGQSLAEMREKRELDEAKLIAEERRRQKLEDQRARKAVLEKIKQDR